MWNPRGLHVSQRCRPTHCHRAALSGLCPPVPAEELSGICSLPAAPPAGKDEKDSIGAKLPVPSKGQEFPPGVGLFQDFMEGAGSMGDLKGNVDVLNILQPSSLRKEPGSSV